MAGLKDKERKSPQKQNKGRSKKGPRTGVRTSGRTALLAEPNLHRAGPGGRKHIEGGAKHLLTFSLPHAFALSLSLSLPMPPLLPRVCAGVLLHSLLFFQDGFSCYLLNKIEHLSKSYDTVCSRHESCWHAEGFNVRRLKSLLWRDKNRETYTCLTLPLLHSFRILISKGWL